MALRLQLDGQSRDVTFDGTPTNVVFEELP
jgi:hypothetical protein